MLDGYGLHQLTRGACDERFGDVLAASPADSSGRGISLAVRQNGAAANLTGATVYFMWKHKVTGERGTEPFSAINAAVGTLEFNYVDGWRCYSGGNGTVWSSSKTAYTYFRIDTASTPGYVTAT